MRIIGILLGIVVVAAGLIGIYLTVVHQFEIYHNHGDLGVRANLLVCSVAVLVGAFIAVGNAMPDEKKED